MTRSISDGEKLQIQAFLESKGISYDCPECKTKDGLKFGTTFMSVPLWDHVHKADTDEAAICVNLLCGSCGFMKFFGAGFMGIPL